MKLSCFFLFFFIFPGVIYSDKCPDMSVASFLDWLFDPSEPYFDEEGEKWTLLKEGDVQSWPSILSDTDSQIQKETVYPYLRDDQSEDDALREIKKMSFKEGEPVRVYCVYSIKSEKRSHRLIFFKELFDLSEAEIELEHIRRDMIRRRNMQIIQHTNIFAMNNFGLPLPRFGAMGWVASRLLPHKKP